MTAKPFTRKPRYDNGGLIGLQYLLVKREISAPPAANLGRPKNLYKGVRFELEMNARDWCEWGGNVVSQDAFRNRVRQYGWPPEMAARERARPIHQASAYSPHRRAA